jgi:hypothetical protein
MYRDYDDLGALYGRGFTLYGLLSDLAPERPVSLADALRRRWRLVIFGTPWHDLTAIRLFRRYQPRTHLVIIDGSDSENLWPWTREALRNARNWPLASDHIVPATVFKRELTQHTLRPHGIPVTRRGHLRGIRPISFAIPESKIARRPVEKTKDFATHIVDPEVAQLISAPTTYAFEQERDYYRDLQRSRFGITTKRSGWDCLRHYEIAANGTVPCFRHLDRKPATCAPHGLDQTNCVSYQTPADLLAQVRALDERRYAALREGARRWAEGNTTVALADRFLTALAT